jgi:ABC-type multidrug transport system ATPase subunit
MKSPLREPAMPDMALAIEGLVVGKSAARALLTFDRLHLERGGACILTGPPGSGKTLLCATLFGVIRPLAGRVTALGFDLANGGQRRKARMRMALVHAAPGLAPDWRILESLQGAKTADAPSRDDIAEMLAFVGIDAAPDQRIATLSPTQQKLLTLVRALLTRAELIIADSLFDGLSKDQSVRVRRLLQQAQHGGAALVLAGADISGVSNTQNYRLANGRVREALPAVA